MHILISGDSLALPRPHNPKTYDYGTETELAVNFHDTYGSLLQFGLQKLYPNAPIQVTNRAQRASTIVHIFNNLQDHLFFFQPDVFILHVGLVDCWIRPELETKQYVQIDSFISYYHSLLHYIQKKPKTKCIIIGICPTSEKMYNRYPGLDNEIKKYNLILNQADEQQFFFIDMNKHLESEPLNQYLLPDDQHLNKSGNKLIYKQTLKIIQAIIETEHGVDLLQQGHGEEAKLAFLRAFRHYPYYLEALYRILDLCTSSLNDNSTFNRIQRFYQSTHLIDSRIDDIITKHSNLHPQ
ncbi:hypothetical protein PAECIP111893_00347 [Paenibacillus plantiphilus]|uniref:SGNH hydrolase-type esterase domain-containing protein n=1 Tax=Paenibacillus plantiphilus TaxID=2905650 RepID=A0ABM9BTB6_9BACL|nr:SGNH/GDSL hydrolase family protein [Paenibacillus plantiphilus]CAH1192864.1 hypothetical protein PAECIP111893_00347 [Paenibacillus plantiphilus]